MKAFIGKLILFSLLILLHALCVKRVQAQSKYDSVDNSIRNFMAEKKIPGFVACIVKDNAILWSNSYGQADIENKVPMSLDAIMNIGSISKTFTATAAMQLWEKGLLDINADIASAMAKMVLQKMPVMCWANIISVKAKKKREDFIRSERALASVALAKEGGCSLVFESN